MAFCPSRSGWRLGLWVLLSGSAWAQNQSPLPPGAPGQLAWPGLAIHVVVSEHIETDRLRALARPGVRLWLKTTSNTIRDSTLEQLGRFDEAWVELRGQLKPVDARVFARAPRVGMWVSLADAAMLAGRLPGARRLAVQHDGPLGDAEAGRLMALNPAFTRWKPSGPIDLLSWSSFRALPGRKVLVPSAESLLAWPCESRPDREPAVEVHVATLLTLSSGVFPCGRGTRVRVPATVETWLVQSLVLRDPSVELVFEVPDDDAASVTAANFDALGLTRR